jgi:endonuclease YncB( thermonuclease family)
VAPAGALLFYCKENKCFNIWRVWLTSSTGIHVLETVRLAHIDTPETINYRATGLSDPAKIYIADNVPIGSYCVVEITRQEKYGRWLADLFFCPGVSEPLEILKNPRVLNDELVRQGFAKRYEGGKK